MPVVYAYPQADYEPAAMRRRVEQLFADLALDALLRPGMKVVLKPNLLMRRTPEEATTTHPALVRAVAEALQARGVTDILLADSPGGPYTPPLLQTIYGASGMRRVAEETGIRLNTDCTAQTVKAPKGVICREFPIITPVAEADLLINLCKLKTHCMTTLSGGVKNLFGTIPGLTKPQLHYRYPDLPRFSEMLVDLCCTVAPAVTLVDAVIAMEGDGPSGGTPRQTGFLAGSADPFALDLYLCGQIGLAPMQVEYLRCANRRGLCADTVAAVTVGGEPVAPIPDFKKPRSKGVDFSNHLPPWLKRPIDAVLNRFWVPRPQIETPKCIGCGKCAESCPPQVIRIENGKAVIDRSGCVRCFCCHEMCPVRAIRIGRGR